MSYVSPSISDGWLKINPDGHQQIGFKLVSDNPFNATGSFDVVQLPIMNWDAEVESCL